MAMSMHSEKIISAMNFKSLHVKLDSHYKHRKDTAPLTIPYSSVICVSQCFSSVVALIRSTLLWLSTLASSCCRIDIWIVICNLTFRRAEQVI